MSRVERFELGGSRPVCPYQAPSDGRDGRVYIHEDYVVSTEKLLEIASEVELLTPFR